MLRYALALLILINAYAIGKSEFDGVEFSSPDQLLSSEYNPLANLEGDPCSIVAGHVNVITGDFIDNEEDISMAGSEPLTMHRNYCSSDHRMGMLYHGWNHNHTGCFKYTKTEKHEYAILHHRNGSQLLFKKPRKEAGQLRQYIFSN